MSEYQMKNNKLISLLLVLLGNVIYALSVKLFLLPANLISCGTTGISLVVNHFTGIPVSAFIFAFNMVMLAVGWGSSPPPRNSSAAMAAMRAAAAISSSRAGGATYRAVLRSWVINSLVFIFHTPQASIAPPLFSSKLNCFAMVNVSVM